MKPEWRDVFDASKIWPADWDKCVKAAQGVGYKYIVFNGMVRDLDFNGICTIEDLEENTIKGMNVRPSVRAFAYEMEAKLRQSEHDDGQMWISNLTSLLALNDGWEPSLDWNYWEALNCLYKEVAGLRESLLRIPENYGGVICGCRYTGCSHGLAIIPPEVVQAITKEAADVGNLAMMISDMVGGMPHGKWGTSEDN